MSAPTFRVQDVRQRRIATNGIELNIAEAGQGPLVLLLHGFPESWYSWRHQFAPLAAAGYHVVAPDMRGYGKSDRPGAIEAYNQVEVVNDIVGLVSALGHFAPGLGEDVSQSCIVVGVFAGERRQFIFNEDDADDVFQRLHFVVVLQPLLAHDGSDTRNRRLIGIHPA